MVGGSIKSYLLKRVSTVRIRPGAPGNMTASRERRRFWFVGAVGGFGPSTPASPISLRGSFRIRPGAPEICRARYHHGAGLFWSKGGIRTVDTRVTNFRTGGVFESARGHQRNIEPGTAAVPGSSGLRHAVVFAASDKESARLLGEQAGACERICLRREP